MKKYSLEFSVGVFVLIGIFCLSYMAVKLGKMEVFGNDGYTVSGSFSSVTGLKAGASVEIAGVAVGKVTAVQLTGDFSARVSMQINKGVALSDDCIAAVKTSGLIGDKYISISVGGSEDMIKPGGEITETQPAVDIEALISKYVFGGVE